MRIQILKRISFLCISGIKKNELKKVKKTFLLKINNDQHHISSETNKGIMTCRLFHESEAQL